MAAQAELVSSGIISYSTESATVYGAPNGDHWIVDPGSNSVDFVHAGTTHAWKIADLLPGSWIATSRAAVNASGMLWLAVRDAEGITLTELDTSGQITYATLVGDAPSPLLPVFYEAGLAGIPSGSYWPGLHTDQTFSIAADSTGGCWYAGTTDEIVHIVPGRDSSSFKLVDSARVTDLATTDGGVWFTAYAIGSSALQGVLGSISADGQINYFSRSLAYEPTLVDRFHINVAI